MSRATLSTIFFFALLLIALDGVLRILAPFSGALLSAFCLALTFYPLHLRLKRKMPRRGDALPALLMVFGVLLGIILPLSLLAWAVIIESEGLSRVTHTWATTVSQWTQGNFGTHAAWVARLQTEMQRFFGIGPDELQTRIAGRMEGWIGGMTRYGAQAASHTMTFIFRLFLMLFALFFFFRDGPFFSRRIAELMPLPARDTAAVMEKTQAIIVGVIRGWFLTSLVQGTVATIGYLLIQLPGAILLGVLTAVIGLLPVVGTFGVWVPVAVILFLKGMIGKGVFILLWGMLIVVGMMDAWVRPLLIGQRVDLPLFPLFFALLGGVEAFGIQGIILGPWLMAITPLMLAIYQRRYHPSRAGLHEPP